MVIVNKLFWIVILAPICAGTGDWYWRDYDGSIPIDAFIAGIDDLGAAIIGQGYCDTGLYTGRIFSGYALEVWCAGNSSTAYNIGIPKILCTENANSFSWFKVTDETFHLDIRDKTLVVAGFHRTSGTAHVARVLLDGRIVIGYSTTYLEKPWIDFQINGTGGNSLEFEVLVYNITK